MRSQVSDWCFSFPRIRGDVPFANAPHSRSARFSPHTRGCSGEHCVFAMVVQVFPAYAGMFRCRCRAPHPRSCFPRIRGDVPAGRRRWGHDPTFSPHTRGCSGFVESPLKNTLVFPAYAGMFPQGNNPWPGELCFPRIRGDVPSRREMVEDLNLFSPHTRGCSWKPQATWLHSIVFPAYAGMFRKKPKRKRKKNGFPRIRGDVPASSYPRGNS